MDGVGIIERMITQNSTEILETWVAGAEQAAAARGLTRPELMNIMPAYLTALARPDIDHPNSVELDLLESQLSSRLRAGFGLDEIVDEFAILGRAIMQTWARSAPEDQPSVAEIDRLLAILQSATTFVTAIFTQHLLTDEQTEKRDLRLLANSFREPAESASPLSPDRLRAALSVITEAMAADTAALLLYNATTRELVLSAGIGIAEEDLTGYARRVGPASLDTTEQARAADAVHTTTLDVTDALRKSGIRAILGVRLPRHRALVGVMYIGLRRQRSFSPRELRRLEALAERLALHVDNARLYTELTEHVAALDVERRLRDQLVSVIAHDLRGPLSSAQMATRILATKKVPTTDVDRHLACIGRNLDRVDRMVTNLLDVERLQAGHSLPLDLHDTDLVTILRDVVADLEDEHPGRFLVHADENLRGIWDPALLRRTIWNLASNALKYGAPGGPILLQVRRVDGGATLLIHNDGSAIPPEEQTTIFKPFARAGAERGLGWGLGLSVVQACAEAHGGRVEVDSAPERGTTFTLHLPADARPEARHAA